jgi:hypothetical protein
MGLEEKIIEELKKSGYPLEIKVTLAWNLGDEMF